MNIETHISCLSPVPYNVMVAYPSVPGVSLQSKGLSFPVFTPTDPTAAAGPTGCILWRLYPFDTSTSLCTHLTPTPSLMSHSLSASRMFLLGGPLSSALLLLGLHILPGWPVLVHGRTPPGFWGCLCLFCPLSPFLGSCPSHPPPPAVPSQQAESRTHLPSPSAPQHLPAMQETQVWSLGREDPWEKEMATHSSILAWRIPWIEEPGRLQSMGLQRVGHDWATSLHLASLQLHVQPQDRPKPRAVLNTTLSWTSHLFSPKRHQSPPKFLSIPFHRPSPAVTPQLTEPIRLPWTHKTPVSSFSTAVFVCPPLLCLPASVGSSFRNGLLPPLSPLPHHWLKAEDQTGRGMPCSHRDWMVTRGLCFPSLTVCAYSVASVVCNSLWRHGL